MFTSAGLLVVAAFSIIHFGACNQQPTNIDVNLFLNVASCGIKNSVNVRIIMKENNTHPGLVGMSGAPNPLNLNICEGEMSEPLPYVTRDTWNATQLGDDYDIIKHPAEFLIITDGGDRCSTSEECIAEMHNFQRNDGEFGYNFYIGGDGQIYEGAGWDLYADSNGGLGERVITVRFIGLYHSDLPPPSAIDAFKKLTTVGMCTGKLSQTYKLISYRQFYDTSSFPGDTLDLAIRKWDHWTEDINPEGSQESPGVLFPIIVREDWNASEVTQDFDALSPPLRYVVISDGGSRCFTAEGCLERIQEEQEENIEENEDVTDNFYVGDDGYVYEGRGWDQTPAHEFTGIETKAIGVKFFGSFRTYLPSKNAVIAFNKLLKLGLWLGKISPDYKILSIRKFTEDTDLLGYRLHEEIRNWKRWSKQV